MMGEKAILVKKSENKEITIANHNFPLSDFKEEKDLINQFDISDILSDHYPGRYSDYYYWVAILPQK